MAGEDVAPGKYMSLPYEGAFPAEQDDVIGRLNGVGEGRNSVKPKMIENMYFYVPGQLTH